MNNKNVFKDEYLPFIIKWGKLTGFLAIILSFGPAIVLAVVYRIVPPISAIITAFIAMASAVGVNWFIEPISYFPIVGVAGTYISFSILTWSCPTRSMSISGTSSNISLAASP